MTFLPQLCYTPIGVYEALRDKHLTETRIIFEEVHPIELLGINNQNLKLIQAAYPKLRVVARGSEIVLKGEESEIAELQTKLEQMLSHIERNHKLSADKLMEILGANSDVLKKANDISREAERDSEDGFILTGNDGNVIRARTPNQRRMVKASEENDLMFAIGPAGTGKTYTAVAIAVRALKKKEVKRIILTRPAVEAGENLGFLPGDLKDKIDPYLRPLYDALDDMIAPEKLRMYMENRTIEVAPLAFMRGRTLNNAYVILDEAQNATHTQLKMFLTRMGPNAKFIITGDLTQIDLPRKQESGLVNSLRLLRDVTGIAVIELGTSDVIRHRLVRDIITAYESWNESHVPDRRRND